MPQGERLTHGVGGDNRGNAPQERAAGGSLGTVSQGNRDAPGRRSLKGNRTASIVI